MKDMGNQLGFVFFRRSLQTLQLKNNYVPSYPGFFCFCLNKPLRLWFTLCLSSEEVSDSQWGRCRSKVFLLPSVSCWGQRKRESTTRHVSKGSYDKVLCTAASSASASTPTPSSERRCTKYTDMNSRARAQPDIPKCVAGFVFLELKFQYSYGVYRVWRMKYLKLHAVLNSRITITYTTKWLMRKWLRKFGVDE